MYKPHYALGVCINLCCRCLCRYENNKYASRNTPSWWFWS